VEGGGDIWAVRTDPVLPIRLFARHFRWAEILPRLNLAGISQ
jgi:hypothetical protein